MKQWFVYILKCGDGTLYTGVTNDLEARLKSHNLGTGAAYTRAHKPVVLVYSESASDRSTAQVRESEIKSLKREEKQALIIGG
jgi:putative endonuclease